MIRWAKWCVKAIGVLFMAYMVSSLLVIDARLIRAHAKEDREVKITRSQTIKYPYVASVTGDVFHRSDSICAKKISERDLIGYKTKADALVSARKQCSACQHRWPGMQSPDP